MPYNTRYRARVLYRTLSKRARQFLGTTAAALAAKRTAKSSAPPRIAPTQRVSAKTGDPFPTFGKYRKPKKRKLRYIDRKPRVAKRFKKSFDKCLAWSKHIGKYTYISNAHLYQTTLNEARMIYQDQEGFNIRCGGPRDVMDAFSVLFNAKDPNPNPDILTDNMPNDAKYNVRGITMKFEFRSTSSHVIEVELYECTAKKQNRDTGVNTLVTQGTNSAQPSYWTFDALGIPISTPYVLGKEGSKFEDLPDIFKQFSVKVHKFTLQPGDFTTKYIRVSGPRTYDMTQLQSNNALDYFCAGSKEFVFKVRNKISMSANAGASKVHSFPSNNIGGVACRYSKIYKVQAPSTATRSEIKVGSWCHSTETTDQQVCFQNPIATTTYG